MALFSASCDESTKMWSVENDENNKPIVECQKTFVGHEYGAHCVLVNELQTPINEIVTCGEDETVKTWNIESGENTGMIKFNRPLQVIKWWKQCQYLIVAECHIPSNIYILQWNNTNNCSDFERGKIVRTLKGHSSCINKMVVDEENDQLLSCGNDSSIRQWNLNTGQQIKQFKDNWDGVTSLCNPSMNLLASTSRHDIKFWDMANSACIRRIHKGHLNWVTFLLYSKSEQVLISASTDKTVKIWDLKFDENTIQQCTHKFTINNPFGVECCSMAFLNGGNDGTRIIVGDIDGNMFIVDVKSGVCVSQMEKIHSNSIGMFVIVGTPKNNLIKKRLQKAQQTKALSDIVIEFSKK